MTHLEFAFGLLPVSDYRFFYRHIVCTKGLFHASCELYHFTHPDIYTF